MKCPQHINEGTDQHCDICGDWLLADETNAIIEGRYCVHGKIGFLKVHRLG